MCWETAWWSVSVSLPESSSHLCTCISNDAAHPVGNATGTCQDTSCERRPIAWWLPPSSLCMCDWLWWLSCIERCVFPVEKNRHRWCSLFVVMSSTSAGWLQCFRMRYFNLEMNYNETWTYSGFGLQSVSTPVGLIDLRTCAATPTPSDLGWECVFGWRQKVPCFCLQFLGKCSDNTQSWERQWWNNKGIAERLEKKCWVLLEFCSICM